MAKLYCINDQNEKLSSEKVNSKTPFPVFFSSPHLYCKSNLIIKYGIIYIDNYENEKHSQSYQKADSFQHKIPFLSERTFCFWFWIDIVFIWFHPFKFHADQNEAICQERNKGANYIPETPLTPQVSSYLWKIRLKAHFIYYWEIVYHRQILEFPLWLR